MSHTARLVASRSTSTTHVRAATSKQAKQQEDELHHAIHQLRSDLHNWDSSSRNLRKSILERFLWLHSSEGAGIGAAREIDTTTMSMANLHAGASSAREKHTEQKELAASPSTILLHGLAVPTSLANASLESLYGAAASLLLMRITSWLRLTYTLRVANLLNLRAIATFCADASGGLRFVHEFVEAGGILTLLSIIEANVGGTADKADADHERMEEAKAMHKQSHSHRLSQSAPGGGHPPQPLPPPPQHAHKDSVTLEAAAIHAAELEKHRQVQETAEKERSLAILLRISTTGRAFKEMICEQRGVGVVINCLARVRREQTQEIAKQLLCQLGMGNPRYASLVHEELLSVFRAPSSNSCKRMVLLTLHFLLSHTPTAKEAGSATGPPGTTPAVTAGHPSSLLTAAIEYDAHGQPIDHFSADARYVEATVSLFHVQDAALHYEANQLLKLLITKHGLQESTLQALLLILKQKTQNVLNSPGGPQALAGPDNGGSSGSSAGGGSAGGRRLSRSQNDPTHGGGGGSDRSGGHSSGGSGDSMSAGFGSDPPSNNRTLKPRNGQSSSSSSSSSSSKHSDPKTCAVKMLNELALMSYELCLRMTQLGVIHLLLDCLCNMQNYELQHEACGLLYTLNNNVVESASLIRYMMSGTTTQSAISLASSSEGLYLAFLKNPDQLHRHLSYADVRKIQHNLRNPPTQTSFLSQRRLERRNTAGGGGAAGGGTTTTTNTTAGSLSRKSSVHAALQAVVGLNAQAAPAGGHGLGVLGSPVGGKGATLQQPGQQQAPDRRKSSGTNFTFNLADPSAHQAHFAAAAAHASASVAPPSDAAATAAALGGSPPLQAVGSPGAHSVYGSPSAHPFGFAPPSGMRGEQNLEEEDARFFVHGMASIARANEADLVATAVRAERQAEKDRIAVALALKEAHSRRAGEDQKQDDQHGGDDPHPDSQTDVIAALQLAARQKLEGLALGHATASSPSSSPSSRAHPAHPDQIHVPALELHFDPKLRLVDQGQPHVPHSKALQLLQAGSTVSPGVHEGASSYTQATSNSSATHAHGANAASTPAPSTAASSSGGGGGGGAQEKGPDGESIGSGVYTPFAQPDTNQRRDDGGKDGAAAAAGNKQSTSSISDGGDVGSQSHLIFSQRVGLAASREVKVDVHSETYLAVHFKDLMQPARAAFLGHGVPGVAEQLQQAAAAASGVGGDGKRQQQQQHGPLDGVGVGLSDDSYLLPDILPSVEILSDVDSLLPRHAKKTAEARQEELKKKRDEKRLKDARVMAAAATEYAQANKYNTSAMKDTGGNGGGGGGGGGVNGGGSEDGLETTYTGFTEKALSKEREKKANEFSSKKALTLDQAASLVAAKKKADARAKEDEMKATAVVKLKSPFATTSAAFPSTTAAAAAAAAAAVASQTSNKQVLQLAMQLDGSGRTIDPRKWGGGRGRNSLLAKQSPTSASGGSTSTATTPSSAGLSQTKKVLPAHAQESPADRAEREAIEAQLAELRGQRKEATSGIGGGGDAIGEGEEGHGEGDHSEDEHIHASALGGGGSGMGSPTNAKERAKELKLRQVRRAISTSHGADEFAGGAPSPKSATTASMQSKRSTTAADGNHHQRARSMSLMVSNVAAGGAAGGAAQSALFAGKDSPRFGFNRDSPRMNGSSGSPAPGSNQNTPRGQLPNLARAGSGSLRERGGALSSMGMLAELEDGDDGGPETEAGGGSNFTPSATLAALKRAPVNTLGKPVGRRSTVMVPGSVIQSRPPVSPMSRPAGALKRAGSVAGPSRPTGQPPVAKSNVVLQTMKKVATTDFDAAIVE